MPVIQPEHMPQNHKKYLNHNSDEFRTWAAQIGNKTTEVIEYFLTSGTQPEEGYKACSSLTKLSDRYGHERLESACERLLYYTSEPTVRNISTILKNGQDKLSVSEDETTNKPSQSGGISRGPGYFRRGGTK